MSRGKPGQAKKHGETVNGRFSKEYRAWVFMVQRCTNPERERYPRYGGRGIRVCERWMKFENFLADMGRAPSKEHSLDRKDNDGHYEPSNCRWATRKEQAMNKSTTVRYEIDGKVWPVRELCRAYNVPYSTFRYRLAKGMSPEAAIKGG